MLHYSTIIIITINYHYYYYYHYHYYYMRENTSLPIGLGLRTSRSTHPRKDASRIMLFSLELWGLCLTYIKCQRSPSRSPPRCRPSWPGRSRSAPGAPPATGKPSAYAIVSLLLLINADINIYIYIYIYTHMYICNYIIYYK